MESQTGSGPTQSNPEVVQTDAMKNSKLMAAIAYVGPLIIVSYVMAKDDPFVKFHIKQALVLFVIEIALWVFGMMSLPFYMIINLLNLGVFILAVIGIISAVRGEEKELPLVGKFSKHFPI